MTDEIVAVRMAQIAEDCGLQAVALHPRTREQGYSGPGGLEPHRRGQGGGPKIPVIGNGDIVTPEDAVRMVRETGCDGVMVGRAASYNPPWIFRQIAEYLATGSYAQPTHEDRYAMMRTYYEMLAEGGQPDNIGKMKQFAGYFSHGVSGGARLREVIYRAREAGEIIGLVDEFFGSRAEPALIS